MQAMINDSSAAVLGPVTPEAWLVPWAASADPAYCRDPEGRIIAANLSFARKFGRTPAMFAGVPLAELVHADDLPALQASTAELSRPPHRGTRQQRWRTPQGVRWFAWEESALHDEDGRLMAICAVGRDTTRQHLAEEQFYRLSRAVEQSPVAIVITDPEGHPQYVNSKFSEVTGRTLEDLMDQRVEVLRDGHPDEESYRQFWQTIRAGGEWRGEISTRRPDGSVVWESLKVSCLRSPAGEITNFLCLREDITERKKLEHELRQAQKMESLGTLAGGIAHDFNNMLAVINGYAWLCEGDRVDAAVLAKNVREIQRAVSRASGLVRQILTFSRKAEVRFSSVDLNQLVRDLVALLSETFPRTVSFNLALKDGLPPLHADQNQLQQVILNLCVNARDAMNAGGTISLTTSIVSGDSLPPGRVDPRRNYARLQVRDTGSGMTPEVRQRIFEPFFTTKQENHGTGLGLAVVYGIVTSHQGSIEVDSTVGVGSTFDILLPLAADVALPAPAVATMGDFAGGTESLLVVDDEDALRLMLTTALTRKGYQITPAASGLEAIELIADMAKHFDLAVLDMNMPGANGLKVLKAIRLCRPQLKVLVVSGYVTADVRTSFEALGQRDIMQKPYALADIGQRIRSLLDVAP
jgi:PAS domain S-box-containing protein